MELASAISNEFFYFGIVLQIPSSRKKLAEYNLCILMSGRNRNFSSSFLRLGL